MKKVVKLAVFDLDDTIYNGNSHFLLLNNYYKTNFFTSIFIRVLGKISQRGRMVICNKFYDYIPKEIKSKFSLPYRADVLELLRKKKKEGWKIVIISNAPWELIKTAADNLHVIGLEADCAAKSVVLTSNFCYEKLLVCTDNKTDIDLLKLADEAVVTCKQRDINFFINRLPNKDITFMNAE